MLRSSLFEPAYYTFANSERINYWKTLENNQYLPEKTLLDMQWRRLLELLSFAWENNIFYRSRFEVAGLNIKKIQDPNDLRKIPILSKSQVRENTSGMISNGFAVKSLKHYKTGGSTGKALDVYLTEECSEKRNACARRSDRWTGWETGEPIAAVWGNPHRPVALKDRIKEWFLSPVIYLDTMNINPSVVKTFSEQWNRVNPSIIFGHAHSIFILAKFVKEMNLSNIRPRGILSTSMMLLSNERRFIEEVFSVKVTDRYGCEEVSLIASECERHERMHLNVEHLFVEFIKEDGNPANSGEQGKIIVTDLLNLAMPFIRYQVEDIGVPVDSKCLCGREMPMMMNVTGRVADFLIKKDGSLVAGISLIENTLTKYSGIDQMQIIQNSFEQFKIRIVPGKEYDDEVNGNLIKYFVDIFGHNICIEIEFVNNILPEISGKYRFSICNIVNGNRYLHEA